MLSSKVDALGRGLDGISSGVLQRLRCGRGKDPPTEVYLALAAMLIILPFDLYQLVFMVSGAFFYACLQRAQPPVRVQKAKVAPQSPPVGKVLPAEALGREGGSGTPHGGAAFAGFGGGSPGSWPAASPASRALRRPPAPRASRPPPVPPPPRREARTPTSRPIDQPVFAGVGWEAEVAELIADIMPTPQSETVVEQIANTVRQSVKRYYPEADVVGFAAGDFRRGKAFGVAVPEVDVVISVPPHLLAKRFLGRAVHPSRNGNVDPSKLQKSALRECTEALVSSSCFKFRRSAFRCLEPKVTLLALAANGVQVAEAVPIDLSVNAALPFHHMALLTECGRIEPRAKELILLVRRWSKDRGVCHAAKGYLSPYLWSLLTMYFLQVAVEDEGPLLPPLEEFEMSSGLLGKKAKTPASGGAASSGEAGLRKPRWSPPPFAGHRKSTAALFKDFVHFYLQDFDWRNEAVSVRLGKRAAPHLKLPLHIVVRDGADERAEVGLSIEDPFLTTRNLGSCTNSLSLARMREELQRAHELCSRDASLTELLELWVPPDEDAGQTEQQPHGDD